MNIALRSFLHSAALWRQKEARSREYTLLLFRMTLNVLYCAQYHRQHCTLHAFEQFGTTLHGSTTACVLKNVMFKHMQNLESNDNDVDLCGVVALLGIRDGNRNE